MRRMKKWLSLLMALALTLTVLPPASARAAETSGTCGEGLRWIFEEDTGELTIYGRGEMDTWAEAANCPWNDVREKITKVTMGNGVRSIGVWAFYGCVNLTNVRIPYAVERISDYAFGYCEKLERITLQNSVRSIGDGAFLHCTSLEEIIIPEKVTEIGTLAFYECTGLKHVTVPDRTESIGADAFANCTNLQSMTVRYSGCQIGDSKNTLGSPDVTVIRCRAASAVNAYADKYGYTFADIDECSGKCGEKLTWNFNKFSGEMTISGYGDMGDYGEFVDSPWEDYVEKILSLTVETGVTSIGECAFAGCTNLKRVVLPVMLTSIGPEAFFYCTDMTELTLQGGLKSIGGGAFSRCYGLKEIKLPRSLENIGEGAFFYCTFEDIVIPAGVKEIDRLAFSDCENLKTVTILDRECKVGDNPWTLGNPDDTEIRAYPDSAVRTYAEKHDYKFTELADPSGKCGTFTSWSLNLANGELTISGTSEVDDYDSCADTPWYGYRDWITGVTVEYGVKGIGEHAFDGLDKLGGIEIWDRDCVICDDLHALGGPDRTYLVCLEGSPTEEYALRYGYGYDPIVEPSGQCGDNAQWHIDMGPVELIISGTGDTWDWQGDDPPWHNYAEWINKVTVENGITGIGSNAFRFCSSIKEVNLPDSLERIGDDAFSNCSDLRSVVIPDNVKTIGDYAFNVCLKLANVSIPEGVQHIGDYAFTFCPALPCAAIPASVTEIGNYAFGYYIDYNDKDMPKPYDGFVIYGYAGTEAEAYADATGIPFELLADSTGKCGPDVSWTLDGKTRELTVSGTGKMWDDVPPPWDKDLIREITIGDGITGIGNYSFSSCLSLKELTIPEGVGSIGEAAFYNCSCLTDVTILNPDCVIGDHPGTLGDPAKTVIRGYKGSTAEDYANRYGYQFEDVTVKPFRFADVGDSDKFYYEPVYWAYGHDPQITNGINDTSFGPDRGCTRGQVVTFLWRAAGCPKPKNTGTTFKDLKEDGFYVKAVAWAVEQGITNGLTADRFGPDSTCTRGQIVTFLWRFRGSPEPENMNTPFTDLNPGGFYLRAVAWAVGNGITNGQTKTAFGPDAICTRGQVVTFLYRAVQE